MKPNIFISYSRREVGFVDDLVGHLENEQYTIWLDYRSLVPGKPWENQIYQGLMDANIILLVVSKASISSDNVEMEWRRVVKEKNKRIILLIFEAVDLPEELEKYEWVDFRGNYKNALKELNRQLQTPEQEDHPAPQMGFKVPSIVWIASGLSVVIALMSIVTLWALFIPFFLIPLPFQIVKRSFQYLFVQASLVMLPFALYLTSLFSATDIINSTAFDLSILSIPFVLALIYVLRSAGMQRWGKPEATQPLFPNHQQVEYPKPEPMAFYIEHAPQDRIVAEEMTEILKSHGHHESTDVRAAKSIFTLVSAYTNDSSADCEQQVVYPMILQSNDNISRQLSRVQWLDFRLGIRNLDVVGKLLDQPEKLLRALCIRPMGNQLVMPPTIMYLTYFIAFLAVVCIGSWFPYILQYIPDLEANADLDSPMIQLVISLILFGTLSYSMGRQLVNRKGPLASYAGLIAGMAGLGLIIFWQNWIDINILGILNIKVDSLGYSSLYSEYLYIYGGLFMLILSIVKRKELRRWLPSKA